MEDIAMRDLGHEMGLEVGEVVTLATDEWAGIIGSRGDRGKIKDFARCEGLTFANVVVEGVDHSFPFLRSEVEKVVGAPKAERP